MLDISLDTHRMVAPICTTHRGTHWLKDGFGAAKPFLRSILFGATFALHTLLRL